MVTIEGDPFAAPFDGECGEPGIADVIPGCQSQGKDV